MRTPPFPHAALVATRLSSAAKRLVVQEPVPMTPAITQLDLFNALFHQPIDLSTQVTRLPGTPDAPCHCRKDRCEWPFCKKPEPERTTT